MAIQKIMDL